MFLRDVVTVVDDDGRQRNTARLMPEGLARGAAAPAGVAHAAAPR
jgi:hypothetical protein